MSFSYGQLLDFIEATGEGHLKSKQDFQNDASQNTFFWGKLFGGLGDKSFVNGGQSIRRPIMFKDNGSFEEYRTGQSRNYTDVNTMEKMTAYLRFADTHYTVRDQEALLNDGGGGDNEFQQFFDLKNQKEASAMTALWNGLENQLFAVPDDTLMEGDGSTQISPYSLFVHFNEWTNGLPDQGPGNTWTEKQGLSPTDPNMDGQYDIQRDTYDSETIGSANTILEGFDRLIDNTNYEQPSSYQQYFASPMMEKCFIVTSTVGRSAVKFLNRTGQDTWERWGEAGIKDPTHSGIPIYRAKQMDTAEVWDEGSGLGPESTADLRGPRFMLINGNYLSPVCHSERFFHMNGPLVHPNDPEAHVVRYVVWWNLIATSLRHHGLLSPGMDNLYYAA